MPAGRPTGYNHEIAELICERLADGESLRKICLDADMPAMRSVYAWLRLHPEFTQQYELARLDQADTLADEITHIADTESDTKRGRLRVDARKWVAAKLKPQKYSDRTQQDHNISGEITMNFVQFNPDMLEKK